MRAVTKELCFISFVLCNTTVDQLERFMSQMTELASAENARPREPC